MCFAFNEFAYRKTKDDCKLEDRFHKKDDSLLRIREFADKNAAYNVVLLYCTNIKYFLRNLKSKLESLSPYLYI
jgi:hypothetical protein